MLSQQAIERARVVLARGEAAILPTDTVPGLFVVDTPEGEARLVELKRRERSKPLTRMFGSRRQLHQMVEIEKKVQELAVKRLLPGRVTLVLSGRRGGTLGVRIPGDASLRELIRKTGPLIATSANVSGEELRDPANLPAEILAGVALMEEDATSRFRSPVASTVIDLTTKRPVVLRKGGVSLWQIERRLGVTPVLSEPEELNVLFVCGGNTCRSPMAALLFADKCGHNRMRVRSAGLSASPGAAAAANARRVMSERGLSLARHLSTRVSVDLFRWADLVLVMTRPHLIRIRNDWPQFADRTFLLSGFPALWPHGRNIADPIGGSLETYREAAAEIQLYIASICPRIRRVLSDAN